MDGTIANLYKEGWLEKLMNRSVEPYANADKLVEENVLLNLVNKGYELGIISWCAKGNNKEYDKAVRLAKREWLKTNYPNIRFTEIHIVKYGTPKYKVANECGILVDDEEPNRQVWKWLAIEPNELERL